MSQKEVKLERKEIIEIESEKHSGKTMLSIEHARSIAQGYINEIQKAKSYMEDSSVNREALSDLVYDLISQEKQNGAPVDFHNFAVALGGVQEDLACEIIDCGLRRFPMDVDLLADFLIYGIDCDRLDSCKVKYDTLMSIEKEDWTWRCFAFSIAYLVRMKTVCCSLEERVEIKKDISQMAKDYKKYLPNYEGGYREIAKLFDKTPEKELKVLTDALSNEKIDSCASIAFRCADILFAQQKYKEALEAIKRSRTDAITQKQGGINKYYLFFLSGLCKIALHMTEGVEMTEDYVKDIYSDFNVALTGIKELNYRDTIEQETKILEQTTGIRVHDEYVHLLDVVGVY